MNNTKTIKEMAAIFQQLSPHNKLYLLTLVRVAEKVEAAVKCEAREPQQRSSS